MSATEIKPTDPTAPRVETLEEAIERAEVVEIAALTQICGWKRLTYCEITKAKARELSASCPGDHTGELHWGLIGDGWTYERRSGGMTLRFGPARTD